MQITLKCVAGDLYVRLAAHVYNEMKDYENLARAIKDIQKNNTQPAK